MIYALAIIALLSMPQTDGATSDAVDVLEVNHVYDDCGREVLTQLIGWEKSEAPCGFSVVFWRLMKEDDRGMSPQFSQATQSYTSEWYDGEVLRRVKAKKRWERWLQYDIEMFDRNIHPKQNRRELTRPDDHFQPTPSETAPDDLELNNEESE